MRITIIARPQVDLSPMLVGRSPRSDQLYGEAGEVLCEAAGRVCYASFGGAGRDSVGYAEHILESGHGSVLEHAQYSFHVADVSRNFTHELVRHRVGVAISQRSTRYVDESDAVVVHHPAMSDASAAADAIEDAMRASREAYRAVVADLVARGHDRKTARGAAARYLLSGTATELVWSANIRTLRHVISLRGSAAADGEMRLFASRLLAVMLDEAPRYFSDLEVST
jgi:thymidylate synthase (FAD)